MSFLVIAVGWFAIGAVAVIAMRRRGHDAFEWAVLFLFLGPLALPLAVSADRHRPTEPVTPPRDGRLDMLVAHDGYSPVPVLVGPASTRDLGFRGTPERATPLPRS